MNLKRLFSRHWFFIGMAAMIAISFSMPETGIFIQTYNVLDIGIFLAFLITGLSLETSTIINQLKNIRVFAASLVSSLIIFPAIAYTLALWVFGTSSDAAVGALILGVAPVTVASGTVMTAMALGNIPLSLFICVLCNFASIFTIPLILNLALGLGETAISLPIAGMLFSLVIKVLLPTIIGQLLRPYLKNIISSYSKAFSIFNQSLVLLIILNAISSSTDRIIQAGVSIAGIFIYMLILHLLVLALNYFISRMIRLDLASTAAFTIHTSQKTLTVSYLVWAGYFSSAFPMALIPAIAYHLVQMILDTFVAHRFHHMIEKGTA